MRTARARLLAMRGLLFRQVYVRDTTPVSPYALMLFGGVLSSEGKALSARRAGRAPPSASAETTLTVDGWIRFRVPRRVVGLLIDLRAQLDRLLQQKTANPSIELTEAGRGLLGAVTALLAAPPPGSCCR